MNSGQKKEARLLLKPFVTGGRSKEQVVVRRSDAPSYLSLSNREYDALLQIAEGNFTVEEWLGSHLSTFQGLAFSAAVELLLKLHQNDFLHHTTPESVDSLRSVLETTPANNATGWQRSIKTAANLFDFEIFSFTNIRVNPALNRLFKRMQSVYGLILIITMVVAAGFFAWPLPTFSADWIKILIEAPEVFLWQAFVAISISASTLALINLLNLASNKLDFLPGSLRITGLCVLNFRLNDDDAWMLFRKQARAYRIQTLLTPWMAALICQAIAKQSPNASFLNFLATGFAVNGFVGLFPLYRGTLIKALESVLASNKIYHAARQYLANGLIVDLFRRKSSINDRGTGSKKSDAQTDAWAAILATLSIAWLYASWLLLSNTMLEALPSLAYHVTAFHKPLRAIGAGILLSGFGIATLMTVFKLIEIPLTNLSAAASIPLRKVRRGVKDYKTPNMSPNDAVIHFLKNIPILGHLSDEAIGNLVGTMKLLVFKANENIVTQGDPGNDFYILADGRARVLIEGINRDISVLDVLLPGDSFGEIALLNKGKRTASVQATEQTKVLSISVDAFDKLFPESSPERTGLTDLLRRMKLVQESQALSHLPPRQIRELVTRTQLTKFSLGDVVIREGEAGDAAYLIESGAMLVTKMGKDSFRAELTRGALVGAIALINDTARTATVTATEDSNCLKIDREIFLNICLSNVLVATLIADMAGSQLEQQEALRKQQTSSSSGQNGTEKSA